jgi:RNA polymerase sigma factor (sigma-70 family)
MRFLIASAGPNDADDVFQETVISALRAYPALRHDGNLRGWLLTIAHNKALDHHRARARRPVPVPALDEARPARDESYAAPDDDLWRLVHDLPPRQRAAVLLRFVGDLAHREVALAMDCSEEAARRALSDGLAKLRKDWTP